MIKIQKIAENNRPPCTHYPEFIKLPFFSYLPHLFYLFEEIKPYRYI